jgi:hypothetical protein
VRGFKQRGEEPNGGALTSAVGANEPKHLAGFNLQIEILNGSKVAVLLPEILEFNHSVTNQSGA